MDVRVPQLAHADNLNGVSGAQSCQKEKLFSAMSLDGLHYVGKVSKTAWVCLPVCYTGWYEEPHVEIALWPLDWKCQGLAFHQKNCWAPSVALVCWACWDPSGEGFSSSFLQLGKQRPKQTWVNDADSHMPSSSPRAAGVHHVEKSWRA